MPISVYLLYLNVLREDLDSWWRGVECVTIAWKTMPPPPEKSRGKGKGKVTTGKTKGFQKRKINEFTIWLGLQ